ncbi:MAG: hypothetical protein IPL08_05675 [Saprospiraceae bacterium]|nr:hypothetical protein [Saprospiraceae bacterium]
MCSASLGQTNTVPNVNAGADKVLTCTTTSTTLNGSSTTAGVTYAWVASNGGNIVSGGTTATPTVNAAGTYTLTATQTATGCTATDVAVVTLNNTLPNVNAGADKVLTCTTTSATLSGSSTTAGVTYAWAASNGGNIVSGGTTATATVNAAGTYTLTVTETATGCTATDVAVVTLNNTLPNVNAGSDKVLTCTTTSTTLNGSSTTAGVTYAWVASNGGNIVSGGTTATPTVNAAGTYTLTVTQTSTGCTATDVAVVTLNNTAPNVNAGADKTLTCIVNSISLNGSSTTTGVSYAWVASNGGVISGPATTPTPTVTAAGTYTLTVTGSNGCTASDVAIVTLNNTQPNAGVSNDGPLKCNKLTVTLTATPATGVSYAWQGGGTASTKTVTTIGTYEVTVTDNVNGCTKVVSTTVTEDKVAPNATADNTGGPLTCIDNSATIRAFPNVATYTYSWSGPNGYTATSRENNVSVAGNYTVTVTDTQNGCTKAATTTVLQDVNVPTANAGPDKSLCNGTSTTLTATGNGSYLWSTNATTATITVSPSATTTYTVTVTGTNGCTASDQADVTVTALPSSGLTGPNEICGEEYAVFNASPSIAGRLMPGHLEEEQAWMAMPMM